MITSQFHYLDMYHSLYVILVPLLPPPYVTPTPPRSSLIKKQQFLVIKAVRYTDKISPPPPPSSPFALSDSSALRKEVGRGEGAYGEWRRVGVNASGKEEAFLSVKSTEPVSESVG